MYCAVMPEHHNEGTPPRRWRVTNRKEFRCQQVVDSGTMANHQSEPILSRRLAPRNGATGSEWIQSIAASRWSELGSSRVDPLVKPFQEPLGIPRR